MTLYINCCPRINSRTDRLARALLKKLGEYEELRLYDEPIRAMDPQRLPHREELLDRGELDGEIFRYSHQFAAADRIVIAAPYWDLSFPAQLKIYIENIYATGIVTRYGADGRPEGMCRAEELIYVTTSGGPFDRRFGYGYVKALAEDYFGIPATRLLLAEGLDIRGNDPEAILQKVMAENGLTEA